MMRISVRVIPSSKKGAVMDDGCSLKLYVTAPAHGGKANRAAVGLLAEHFGVKKSAVRIVSGLKSHNKIIEIEK